MAQTNNLTVVKTSMETKSTSETSNAVEDTNTRPTAQPSVSASAQSVEAKEVPFTMSLEGSYNDFLNFLRAIDSSSRLISLKSLSLKKTTKPGNDQTQTQTIFSADIIGIAFYKKDITIEKTLANLRVSDETILKFLNLKSYGNPINLTTEAGFGRANPFEGY